jgi:hypothetical protein
MDRDGKADLVAVMILMCSIVLLAGCFLYLLTNPAFTLGYKPGDPHMLFQPRDGSMEVYQASQQPSSTVQNTELTLNQTLTELKSRGITIVECRLNNYNESKCTWVDNDSFIKAATDKKLAILHTTEDGNQVLLVPLKDAYVAWRES